MVTPNSYAPRSPAVRAVSSEPRRAHPRLTKTAGAFVSGRADAACLESTLGRGLGAQRRSPLYNRQRPQPLQTYTNVEMPKATPRASSSSPEWNRPCSPALQAVSAVLMKGAASAHYSSEGRSGPCNATNTSRRPSRALSQASSSVSTTGTGHPPSSVSSRTPSPWSSVQSRCGIVSVSDLVERCGCITKEDFEALFDAFDTMDRGGEGSITRANFFWALKTLGTSAAFQRAVNKAKLTAHFHKTASELPIDAFIRRACPTATEADVLCMLRWAGSRKAHNIVTNGNFEGTEAELRDAFALLDEGKNGEVSVSEILHARLFSREEVETILPPQQCSWMLRFEEFCGLVFSKYWDERFGLTADGSPGCVWRNSVKWRLEEFRKQHGGTGTKADVRPVSAQTDASAAESIVSSYTTATPVPPSAPPKSPARPRGLRRNVTPCPLDDDTPVT